MPVAPITSEQDTFRIKGSEYRRLLAAEHEVENLKRDLACRDGGLGLLYKVREALGLNKFCSLSNLPNDVAALRKVVCDFIKAHDAGQIEIASPEIGGEFGRPHPWHEEWLYRAREAARGTESQ